MTPNVGSTSGGGRITLRLGVQLVIVLASVLATPGVLATLTDGVQNDAGSGTDAGDSPGTATHVTGGAWEGRTIVLDDPSDWYAFDVIGAPSEPVVDVHLEFAVTSLTCTGADVPVSLQSVSIQLLDPQGSTKGLFTTTGCDARGRFDVEERPPLRDGQPAGPNPGVGTWKLGVTIQGLGGTRLPHVPLPIGGASNAAAPSHAGPRFAPPGSEPPRADSSPPDLEQDYAFMLGCKPFC